MKTVKKLISLIMAVAMAFLLPVPAKAAEETVTLTVLATSDVHGRIYPWEYAIDSPDEAGFGKLAALIKQERKNDPQALLIDNGDTIESNMIDLFKNDETHPMIKVLNQLGYDAWVLGNHEFNFGLDVLGKAVRNFKGTALSANILKEDGTTFVKPYIIKEMKGIKVGILGMTTPHIPIWEKSSPDHYKGLSFENPLDTAKKYVDILRNQEKVDVLIGSFHMGETGEGYQSDKVDGVKEILEAVPGFDAVIVGHAHSTIGDQQKQVIHNGTIILEPADKGKYLGKFELTVKKQGQGYQVVDKRSSLLPVKGVEADKEILDAMKYVDERSKAEANKIIGKASGDFVEPDAVKGIPTAQVQDTALVDLINKVQLAYTKADVSSSALFDPRSNIKAGEVKYKDAAFIYKYTNTLTAYKITGKNLKAYMEWSASYYNTQRPGDVTVSFNPDIRGYNYDMFAVVNYKIDISKPAGSRIADLTFKGKPVTDDMVLTLAVNNYRAGSTLESKGFVKPGDKVFDSLKDLPQNPEVQKLIAEYITKQGTIQPEVDNNWSLVGVNTGVDGREEAIRLINAGIVTLPSSEDGRTPNVKSVNLLEKVTSQEIQELAQKAGVDAGGITGTDLTRGELYKQIVQLMDQYITVDVLQINDFHGALENPGPKDKNPGAAKLVSAIKAAKEKNPNTVVVSSGDNYNGTALSNLLYGEPVAKVLKEGGFAMSAVGNHEFDWGLDKFAKWEEVSGIPFIAANIYDKTTGQPVKWAQPYKIVDVSGIKVGFIGLTTPETAYKTKPDIVEHLEFKNPAAAAKECVPEVKKAGADIVILLSHIGTSQDPNTRAVSFEAGSEDLIKIPGVDGIITGHSHQSVAGIAGSVPVVQGYYNGRTIGKLSFTVNKKTKKVAGRTASLDELYKHKADLTDDAATKAIVDEYQAKVGPILNEVIGSTKRALDHDRYMLSTLGEWGTDAMKASAGTDIAVNNGGGFRTGIEAGDITVGKLYEVMPFDNVLSKFEMTGAQIKEIFEHGIENKEIGSVQFSGVKVEYIPGAAKGKKVVKMTLDNGEVIQPQKTYTVVTNDFMATGGDGYTMFKGAKSLGETVAIRDILIRNVKDAKILDYRKAERLIPVQASTVQAPLPVSTVPDREIKEYVIQSGDTLWGIGIRYKVYWKRISEFNRLKNPDLIFPGQKLLIPVAAP